MFAYIAAFITITIMFIVSCILAIWLNKINKPLKELKEKEASSTQPSDAS